MLLSFSYSYFYHFVLLCHIYSYALSSFRCPVSSNYLLLIKLYSRNFIKVISKTRMISKIFTFIFLLISFLILPKAVTCESEINQSHSSSSLSLEPFSYSLNLKALQKVRESYYNNTSKYESPRHRRKPMVRVCYLCKSSLFYCKNVCTSF